MPGGFPGGEGDPGIDVNFAMVMGWRYVGAFLIGYPAVPRPRQPLRSGVPACPGKNGKAGLNRLPGEFGPKGVQGTEVPKVSIPQ